MGNDDLKINDKDKDISALVQGTDRKRRVVALVNSIQQAECPVADVFALDNTNAIEGYFNGIKQRMQVSPLTLLDVFRAVDSTERTVLASGSPSTAYFVRPFTRVYKKVIKTAAA